MESNNFGGVVSRSGVKSKITCIGGEYHVLIYRTGALRFILYKLSLFDKEKHCQFFPSTRARKKLSNELENADQR